MLFGRKRVQNKNTSYFYLCRLFALALLTLLRRPFPSWAVNDLLIFESAAGRRSSGAQASHLAVTSRLAACSQSWRRFPSKLQEMKASHGQLQGTQDDSGGERDKMEAGAQSSSATDISRICLRQASGDLLWGVQKCDIVRDTCIQECKSEVCWGFKSMTKSGTHASKDASQKYVGQQMQSIMIPSMPREVFWGKMACHWVK